MSFDEFFKGRRKPYRYPISGVEVFSMSFKNKKKNANDSDPTMALDKFKGKIFLADIPLFHAIYDSEKEEEYNQLYTELPPKNKRPRVDHPILDLSATPTEDEEEEEEIELPVMGPPLGCLMVDDFSVLVHDVTGPKLPFSLDCAPPPIPYQWGDCDMAFWDFSDPSNKCNEPTVINVDGAFGSVKLHCMMFGDSKVARVQVEWIPKHKSGTATATDEILICGEITVSCPTFQSCKSVLLKTPTDKAIKVSVGQPIPLLKYVVCIPNESGFIVSANLVTHPTNGDDSAATTVSGSVDFSKCLHEDTSEFYTGFNSPGFEVRPHGEDDVRFKQGYKGGYYCKSTKFIEGANADLRVSAYVDIN